MTGGVDEAHLIGLWGLCDTIKVLHRDTAKTAKIRERVRKGIHLKQFMCLHPEPPHCGEKKKEKTHLE